MRYGKRPATSQRLASRLKLQGVVNLGGDLVAYVQVEKEGVKTVRARDKLLEFAVQKVEPGLVVLNLEGVEVSLTH